MAGNPYTTDAIKPPTSCFPIVPGAAKLDHPIRAISFDTAGTVTFTDENGVSCTSSTLAAGVLHSLETSYITAATVTGLVGWY